VKGQEARERLIAIHSECIEKKSTPEVGQPIERQPKAIKKEESIHPHLKRAQESIEKTKSIPIPIEEGNSPGIISFKITYIERDGVNDVVDATLLYEGKETSATKLAKTLKLDKDKLLKRIGYCKEGEVEMERRWVE
jgi:hypothetical protein